MLLAAAVALVSSCAGGGGDSSSAGVAASPRLRDLHACASAPGFRCATLTVPLDRRRPGGRTLELQVATAANAHAPRGVLLFLTGGPGQPGVPFAARISRVLRPVARAYRIVLFDQRGTGAGALDCPALQEAIGASDLAPPPAAAVRACAAALGDVRSLYGTDDVVADMEALRRALGVRRLTLDGVSYGTFVAERYALAHPRHVAALVLDSVVPHDAEAALSVTPMRESARVLRLACAGSCPSDPARDLAAVVRRRPVGPRLLDALTLLSIADPSMRRIVDVPAILRDARGGDWGPLERLLALVRRFEAVPAEELSQGLHASALCGDWRFPWGRSDARLAGRAAALSRWAGALPSRATWPFDRATASGTGFMLQCLPWPPAAPTPAPAPGTELPRVPTLLLAGDHDLSTPLPWARAEARLAPRGRLVIVAGAGHSVQSRARDPAGRRAVVRFLLHPTM